MEQTQNLEAQIEKPVRLRNTPQQQKTVAVPEHKVEMGDLSAFIDEATIQKYGLNRILPYSGNHQAGY